MTAPRVVVASDSFKGSLGSLEVGSAVAAGIHDVRPDAAVEVVPVADGGEGTVAAALRAGFRGVAVDVPGPTGEPVTATLAVRDDDSGRRTVLVELADCCGLGRLPGGRPAPLVASSRGLGVAIRAALDLDPATLVVGVGGSASTDGGAGMLVALGADLRRSDGTPVPDGGAALLDLATVEGTGLDPRLGPVDLVLAADVDSPLLGPAGAAAVFGPQKGAGPDDVTLLDRALAHWAGLAAPEDPDAPTRPGAGAAGGVGFALLAVLGARRRSGVDVVLDLVGIDARLAGADLVVTGEGSIDDQTATGKAVTGVVRRAVAAGVPVVAACGRNLLSQRAIHDLGLTAAYPLSDLEPDGARSMADAAALLRRTGARIAQERLSAPA